VISRPSLHSVQLGTSVTDCLRHGFTDPNMRQVLTVHRAGAGGLTQVLTGTGMVSALGWSATWVWMDHIV
jgi:hypothetical protein